MNSGLIPALFFFYALEVYFFIWLLSKSICRDFALQYRNSECNTHKIDLENAKPQIHSRNSIGGSPA